MGPEPFPFRRGGRPRALRGGGPLATQQDLQVHRLGHRPVAGIPRVEVVAGVVGGGHPRRVGRVAQRRVQVDHRVERAVRAQPGVELLAQGILVRMVVIVQWRAGQGAGKRWQRGADDTHAPVARTFGQGAIARLQFGQRRSGLAPGERGTGPADVVDADQHDDAGYPGLIQCIALEAGQSGLTHAVAQQPIAGNTRIDHRHPARGQPRGQVVGPALVLVEAGRGAIGDRVADHHHAARAGVGLDVDTGQEQERGGAAGSAQRLGPALVASGDPAGLATVPMERLDCCRPRHEDTDLQRLAVVRGKRQRVAQPLLAGADQHAGLAIEAEWPRGAVHACGDAGGADPQRLRTVGIAQAHPQPCTAQADARGLAERLVMQRGRDQRREQEIRAPDRLRAGLPAGDPVRSGRGAGRAGQGEQNGGSELAQTDHRSVRRKGTAMVIPGSPVN